MGGTIETMDTFNEDRNGLSARSMAAWTGDGIRVSQSIMTTLARVNRSSR